MTISAIIFDMDGVLIDSEPHHFLVEKEYFRDLTIEPSEEEHHSFVGLPMEKMWAQLKERYSLEAPLEELIQEDLRRRLTYFRQAERLVPLPGIIDLLNHLQSKRLPLGIASSSPGELVSIILKKLALTDYFSIIISGDQVLKGKPAPDIFLKAAMGLGVPPEGNLVIEDSENGVRAAKSAGMGCFAIRNPNSGRQDLSAADMIFNSVADIQDVLDKRVPAKGFILKNGENK
ncbi:MAG: HAD family phosphatase [Spirochaetales bacterium]|nr:HAD family phosphatase [Spirochaetales bacterium]